LREEEGIDDDEEESSDDAEAQNANLLVE